MKAMVFAAGLGTRLRPLTDNCPKCLIELNGQPMLERVITRLIEAGVREMVVNVHHLAPMVKSFLDVSDNFGITIHVSDESSELLDTGGGILQARQWLDADEPFIVHNADIITDLDYRAMLRSHEQSGADATLLTAPRATSRYLLFNDDNRLRGWYNRSTGATIPDGIDPGAYRQLAFGGVHIISPQRFFPALERYADGRKVFPVIPFYTSARDSLDIRSYCPPTGSYRWADIGKPESLEAASKLFQ